MPHYLAASPYAPDTSDLQLAEVALLDGAALDAAAFGETEGAGWVAKDPANLPFGANGFYLDFADADALAADASGAGNHFTSVGIDAADAMANVPQGRTGSAGGGDADTLLGGVGDDILNGGGGADLLDGGDGTDTASYSRSMTRIAVDLAAGVGTEGEAGGDRLVGIENVEGSDLADVIRGDAGGNRLNGGSGNDELRGGLGNDVLDGGDGLDVAVFSGSRFHYTVTRGSIGAAVVSGADGIDALTGIETLRFGDGDIALDRNNAPILGADSLSTIEDGSVIVPVVDLLANDLDFDGDALSISAVGNAVRGSVTLDGADFVIFTPTADFNGMASFEYTVSDGQGGSATRTVSVAVAAVNDAPQALVQSVSITEDRIRSITAAELLATASDIDGDTLTLSGVGNAANGSVQLEADGNVTFAPNAGFFGSASFDYTVSDGQGGAATGRVSVDVVRVIDGRAIDGYIEGATVFADANGNGVLDTGEASAQTGLNGAFALVGGAGPLTMVGGVDVSTGLAFTGALRASDSSTVITPLTTLVAALMERGHSEADATSLIKTAFALPDTADIAHLDPVSASLSADPAMAAQAGSVMIAGVLVQNTVLQAAAVLAGARVSGAEDAAGTVFDALATVIAADPSSVDLGDGAQLQAILTLAGGDGIIGIAASAASVMVNVNLALTEFAAGGAIGTMLLTGLAKVAVVAQGELALQLEQAAASGAMADVVLAYSATNLNGIIAAATVADIDGATIGTASADVLIGTANTDVIVGGAGDDTLNGFGGSDTLIGGVGSDIAVFVGSRFDYQILRGTVGSATVTGFDRSATIDEVETLSFADGDIFLDRNNAPEALASSFSASEDTAKTIVAAELLAGASDVDGDILGLSGVGNAVGGAVVLNGDGSITFIPDADFNGNASFCYTITDGQGGFISRTATVSVAAVNDAPELQPGAAATAEDVAVTIPVADLLVRASDAEGDALVVMAVNNPVGGSVLYDQGTQIVVFTPAANFNGQASFDFVVSDVYGASSVSTETVDTAPVNDAPVAIADTFFGQENQASIFLASALLENDQDIDEDQLSLTAVRSNTTNAVVQLDANGDVVLIPITGFSRLTSFEYSVSDGHGGTATQMVTVDVIPYNAPPIATDSVAWAPMGIAVSGQLTASDVDALAGELAFTLAGVASHGTVTVNADGTYAYTPTAGFAGLDSFRFQVADLAGATALGTVTVGVDGAYQIVRSVRFDAAEGERLMRVPSVSGDRRTWTFSAWVKNTGQGGQQVIMSTTNGASPYFYLRFNADGRLEARSLTSDPTPDFQLISTAIFGADSGWHHVAMALDTTNATAEDRVRLYVDGGRVMSFATAILAPQNYQSAVNWSVPQHLAAAPYAAATSDLQLADVMMVDGQALSATAFGQQAGGAWVAKQPEVTSFGTNGYHLSFTDTANFGLDSSGRGNFFTTTGLGAGDGLADTP